MMNVGKLRQAVEAAPGDEVAMAKNQLDLMFAEIEAGQQARRALKLQTAIADIATRSPVFLGVDLARGRDMSAVTT